MGINNKGRLSKKLNSARGTGVAYDDFEHRADPLIPTETQMAKSAESINYLSTLPIEKRNKTGGFMEPLNEFDSSKNGKNAQLMRALITMKAEVDKGISKIDLKKLCNRFLPDMPITKRQYLVNTLYQNKQVTIKWCLKNA
jgi:hypothetical protein